MAQKNLVSMADGLRKMLSDLALLKAMPDADPQVLQAIEDTILGFLKQQSAGAAAGAAGGQPGGQPGQQGGGDMASLMAAMQQQQGGGDPNAMPPANANAPGGGGGMTGLSPGMMNPDELRRVIGGTGVTT